jgi:hypothetical protein
MKHCIRNASTLPDMSGSVIITERFNCNANVIENDIKNDGNFSNITCTLYLSTNNRNIEKPVSEITRNYLQPYFESTPEIEREFSELLHKLHIEVGTYDTIHIRMGDHTSSDDHTHTIPDHVYESIKKYRLGMDRPCVILTDSVVVKEYFSSTYSFISTPFKPIHLGSLDYIPLSIHSKTLSDGEEIKLQCKNTWLELLLVRHSRCVYAYSSYCFDGYGASGFVEATVHLYNKDLILI